MSDPKTEAESTLSTIRQLCEAMGGFPAGSMPVEMPIGYLDWTPDEIAEYRRLVRAGCDAIGMGGVFFTAKGETL